MIVSHATSALLQLPFELLHVIFGFLDIFGVMQCSLTCKALAQIINMDAFWKHKCQTCGFHLEETLTSTPFRSALQEKDYLYPIRWMSEKCSLFKAFYIYKTRTLFYGGLDVLSTMASSTRKEHFLDDSLSLFLCMDRLQFSIPVCLDRGVWSLSLLEARMTPHPCDFEVHLKFVFPRQGCYVFPISAHDLPTAVSSPLSHEPHHPNVTLFTFNVPIFSHVSVEFLFLHYPSNFPQGDPEMECFLHLHAIQFQRVKNV